MSDSIIQITPIGGSTIVVKPPIAPVVQVPNKPAATIVVSSIGKQGAPGPKGDNTIQAVAAESISTGNAVVIQNNRAYKYNIQDITHIGRMAGIAKTSGTTDQPLTIQTDGIVTDPAYDFEADKPCFVAADGSIKTARPAGLIVQPCGFPINTKTFFLNIQSPIIQKNV